MQTARRALHVEKTLFMPMCATSLSSRTRSDWSESIAPARLKRNPNLTLPIKNNHRNEKQQALCHCSLPAGTLTCVAKFHTGSFELGREYLVRRFVQHIELRRRHIADQQLSDRSVSALQRFHQFIVAEVTTPARDDDEIAFSEITERRLIR